MPERMLFRLPVRDLFQENKEFLSCHFSYADSSFLEYGT